MKCDEYQRGQYLLTGTITEHDIVGCWKVYDFNRKCFCCQCAGISYVETPNIVSIYINNKINLIAFIEAVNSILNISSSQRH